MNATDTNAGGWEKSELRAKMNSGEIWNFMPSDFQSKVKAVEKLTNNVSGTDKDAAVTATTDKLFLLSYSEIVPSPNWADYPWTSSEGIQYEAFKGKVTNYSGNAFLQFGGFWWERSVCPNSSTLFRHVHTADAAAYVEGDTLWLFAGHDEDDAPNNEYKMKDWLTFSTTDLKHWHQHPVGLDISAFKWADSKQAFAGHVAKRNGKYYWYVSTNWCGIGVAVSDNIMGPWRPMGLIDGVSGNSNTTHPSIVKFKDQWLYFTHDGSLHDGHSYKRSVVMKKLEYNADGTIKPIDSTPSIVRK